MTLNHERIRVMASKAAEGTGGVVEAGMTQATVAVGAVEADTRGAISIRISGSTSGPMRRLVWAIRLEVQVELSLRRAALTPETMKETETTIEGETILAIGTVMT
jgi:hypothetical protein